MNFNKLLVVGLLGSAIVSGAVAETASTSPCGNGGFYIGVNAGASFRTGSVKIDTAAMSAKATEKLAALKAALEKQTGAMTTATAYFTANTNAVANALGTQLFALVNAFTTNATANTITRAIAAAAYPAIAGTTVVAGSLAAIQASTLTDSYTTIMQTIIKYLPATALNDATFKTATADLTLAGVANAAAVQAAVATMAGTPAGMADLAKISALIGTGSAAAGAQTLTAPTGVGTATGAITANEAAIFAPLAAAYYVPAAGTAAAAGAYGILDANKTSPALQVASYLSANTAVKGVIDAMNNSTSSTSPAMSQTAKTAIAALFTDATNKTFTDVATLESNPVANLKVFEANLDAYGSKIAATEAAEFNVNSKGRVSKHATGFLLEGVVGYDHRINDVMIGIDALFGAELGGKVNLQDSKNTAKGDGVTVRRQFYVGLMPRVGYLFTPQFEGYLTAGGTFGKYKADTTKLTTVLDNASGNTIMFKAINDAKVKLADGTTLAIAQGDLANATAGSTTTKYKSHNKWRISPVVGAGVIYNITPEIAARLEYNFTFNTRITTADQAGAEIKTRTHTVKAGVMFRF